MTCEVIERRVLLKDLEQALNENGFAVEKNVVYKTGLPSPRFLDDWKRPVHLAFLCMSEEYVIQMMLFDHEVYLWRGETEAFVVDGECKVYQTSDLYYPSLKESIESL